VAAGRVSFDYTADHEASWTTDQPGDRLFHITFNPRVDGSDTDVLSVGIISKRKVNVDTAVKYGCISKDQQKAAVQSLLDFSDVGSTTKTAVDRWAAPYDTTALMVTLPTLLYRGLTFALVSEREALQRGHLLSKLAYNLTRSDAQGRANAWKDYGPEVEGPYDDAALGMQLLAAKSSAEPKSQFVSVALDFKTAKSITQDIYVYAFQAVPSSPVLGLKSCVLGQGEDQLQVFGGTEVWNLCRKDVRGQGKQWASWDSLRADWVAPAPGYCPPS
jgi:hypothetical protein